MGPAFNRLWASSLVSNLADGVLMAAAPLLAITLTDSTVLISAIGAMVMLPWLLFAMPIGVMVDRVDRRFILAGSNAIRSAVIGAVALGIATDHITIYWLIFSGFIIGVCEVATDTTAQSLIPQILDEEHYEKGNSRLQISETVIQGFIGSPLSGFLYAFAIWLPFFINSIGYAVATLFALSIPIQYLQDVRTESSNESKPSYVEDIKFGIKYLYSQKVLRRLVLTTATIGVCYSAGTATMVLFIIKELELSPKYFGVVLSIQGVGALLGAIVAPKASKKFGRSIIMTLGITSSSVVLLLQGFATNIYFRRLSNICGICYLTVEHFVDGYLSKDYSQ
jgi:MFS family permease